MHKLLTEWIGYPVAWPQFYATLRYCNRTESIIYPDMKINIYPDMKLNQSRPFRLQHDQYDCGVACLRNILNYYKAEISLEKLREWSGADCKGTTLLGLHQAATQSGFIVRGAHAESVADLRRLEYPCILHVTPDGRLKHYVVYYPDEKLSFLIGDPAIGLVRISGPDLAKIWTSRTLLLLEPGERLSQWQLQRRKKFHWLRTTLNELYRRKLWMFRRNNGVTLPYGKRTPLQHSTCLDG